MRNLGTLIDVLGIFALIILPISAAINFFYLGEVRSGIIDLGLWLVIALTFYFDRWVDDKKS